MKKSLIALAVLGATSSFAMAASNVTLYGVIETGIVGQKLTEGTSAQKDATFAMKSGFDQGSRWGIKGTEDLGNGYSVGFILEQGYNSDNGTASEANKQFRREAILNVKGGFGSLAWGRTGTLSSGAQSQNILTGWALGTGFGLSAWSSLGTNFGRVDNVISYVTPKFDGFTIHAMYSNGLTADDAMWSENNHYYGLGVKFQEAAIKSSLILEAVDGKGTGSDAVTAEDLFGEDIVAAYKLDADQVITAATADKEKTYVVNFGFEYNLGDWTPMFAYQYTTQDGGLNAHMFGLSAKVPVAGGDVLVGARYITGEKDKDLATEKDVSAWNIGAAYIYPLSKRTAIKTYAGYADGSDGWSKEAKVNYNGYQVYVGMRHSF